MSKVVLITGASRGIGSSAARAFSENGYNVVLNYNNSKEQAMSVLNDIRRNKTSSIALKADVSKRKEAEYLIDKSLEQFGHIDVLINNAGIAQQKMFTEITEQDWKKMFSVNIDGMFNCTQLALRDMIKRHKGKIINVSSIWGIAGASCEVHYSTSKAAVIGFTKSLAKELGPSGIQVNCVAPGVIETDMNKNLDDLTIKEIINETPLERIGTPRDIANTILFLAQDASDFITGQVISPNGGFVI